MTCCPLCASKETSLHAQACDIEYYTSDATFDIRACDPCGILFIDPMLQDRLGEIYPPNYYSFVSAKRSIAVAAKEKLDRLAFRRLLRDVRGEDLSVFDIGGGTGWLLDLIKSADPRVTSTTVVDLDPSAGTRAEASGHRFCLGRFEDADLEQGFDLILMLNLIEHVPDPRAILVKARGLLKPGGRVLIKTPNFDALDARLFRHRSWGGYHAPRHFILFQRESLERLCREAGFATARFTYTQGAPFWSVSLLEELRRAGLVTISAVRPAIYHPLMPVLQIAAAAFDFCRRPFAKLSQMELVLETA